MKIRESVAGAWRDSGSAATQRRGVDDGWRGATREIALPAPRTSAECEVAARAILEDGAREGCKGSYESWSDFLPGGATDLYPGDVLDLNAASRGITCSAVIREVAIEAVAGDHAKYRITFADESAESLTFMTQEGQGSEPRNLGVGEASSVAVYPGELSEAEITAVSSTSVSIDAGALPPAGGGIEVRRSDTGWNAANDRNLAGRFAGRTFTLPRLSRVQDYYLRPYDAAGRYSRYSVLLHVDYPL